MKNNLNYKLLNILLIMIMIYLAYLTSNWWWGTTAKLLSILAPFIIAFAVAYCLHPLVKWLEKKGVRKHLAVALVVITILAFIVTILSFTLPLIYEQLLLFTKMILTFIGNVSDKFDLNLGGFEIAITDSLNTIVKDLGKYISNGTIDILNKSISFLTNLVIVIIASIYFLLDMDKIRQGIKEFFSGFKKKTYRLVTKLDQEITNYFKGLGLFMLIELIEYSLLFLIIGHPNWLLLGVLAAVTTIIPYIGGFITNVVAIVIASVISTKLMVLTFLICIIVPNIDGYFVSPKIYGKTNQINPLLNIMAVFVGGALGGMTGIILALPLLIILSTIVRTYKSDIKKGIETVKEKID